jgi:general L-amino acid transport system substrate-binding protein
VKWWGLAILLMALTSAAQAEDVLSRVRHDGVVRCAVDMTPGFTQIAASGDAQGFDIDFCRAIAAATLGDSSRIAIQRINSANKYQAVAEGSVDVAFGMASWTLSRDTVLGTRFPEVFFHDGQGFMAWADTNIRTLSDSRDSTVCVQSQTTSIDTLKAALQQRNWSMRLMEFASSEEKWNAFAAHRCQMVTGDRSELSGRRATMASAVTQWRLLDETISREPLGPVIGSADERWDSIVRWVVLVPLIAEARDVTSASVAKLPPSNDVELNRLAGRDPGFGRSLSLDPLWARHVIEQVGNYAEIYDRNLGPQTPFALDRGLNALWSQGGLFYPPSLR